MASLGELFIELGVLGNDEGAKKVAKSIDEVIDKATKAAKKLKEQTDKTNELNKSSKNAAIKIKAFAKGVAGIVTAISGAIYALNRLSDSLVQQNQYWINLTRNSNLALSTYQKWGAVGAAIDKSLGFEGAAGAVKALNDQIFEYRLTGQNAEGFLFAGITPTNADDVLEQLRVKVSGMNDDAASYMLRKLGIDERMLALLRLSKKEFEELNAEMRQYQLTLQQRQQIQEFHKQMSIVNVKMQYFKDRILIALLPIIEQIMKLVVSLTEMLIKHKGVVLAFGLIITKTFSKWLKALPLIGKFLKPIIKSLQIMRIFGKGLLKGLTGIITKLPIVGALFGKLGGIISKAFWPLTAIYLLIDDVRAFLQGGRSGIGYLMLLFEELSNKINFETPEWLKNLLYVASKMPNIVEGIQAIKDINEGKDVKVNSYELAQSPFRIINPYASIPQALANIASSVINNNNQNNSKNINQTVNISTNQPIETMQNHLQYAQANMSG